MKSTQKMHHVRSKNKNLLRNAFRHKERLIASEIAKATQLSVVTVNGLLEEMCATGEVMQAGIKKQRGGRPCMEYQYNRSFYCGGGLYAYDRENSIVMQGVVVNIFGEELYSESATHRELSVQKIDSILESMKGKYPQIKTLVMGFPGFESSSTLTPSDFSLMLDNAFVQTLSARHQIEIHFINDCNAAISGYHATCADDHRVLAGIYFPQRYPPGMGIMIDGALYEGTDGFAGELNMIPVATPWDRLASCSETLITEQIVLLLIPIICTIAPKTIVLYGEYLNDTIFQNIKEQIHTHFEAYYTPELVLRESIYADFKGGISRLIEVDLKRDME